MVAATQGGGITVASTFAVMSSNDTIYIAALAVLSSSDVSYTVPKAVLSANDTSYTPV